MKTLITLILCFCLFAPLNVHCPIQPKLQSTEQVLKDYNCLYEALHFEARGEPVLGVQAVAEVILNRVKHKKFPNSVCAVVKQPKQFSYRNHLSTKQSLQIVVKAHETEKANQVKQIAFLTVIGSFKPVLEDYVVFYHAKGVNKSLGWNKPSKLVLELYSHKFFKE